MPTRTHDHPLITKRVAGATHGSQTPSAIVLHCTESLNRPGLSDVLAIPNFWKNQGLGYNAHCVIDGEGLTAKCALDVRKCWAVAGANTGRLHIEFIGSSSLSRSEWAALTKGLKQGAKWCAYWSETHGIPIALSTVHGIGTHGMYSNAYHVSDHTDPGPNFPLAWFMDTVRFYHQHGWYAAPNA